MLKKLQRTKLTPYVRQLLRNENPTVGALSSNQRVNPSLVKTGCTAGLNDMSTCIVACLWLRHINSLIGTATLSDLLF